MAKTALYAAVLALLPGMAVAEPCAQAPCRPAPTHVGLMAADGHTVDVDFDPLPYIAGGTITILPGETLIFRFSPTGEAPGVPVFVATGSSTAPRTLVSDDPMAEKQADPRTGENLYIVKQDSPALEGGTAADHLKDMPPGTMILTYHQVTGKPDMALSIEHNLDKPLKFDAAMNVLRPGGGKAMEATTTCPVMPVLYGQETWPYPIGAITLTNFHFLDVSSGFSCD